MDSGLPVTMLWVILLLALPVAMAYLASLAGVLFLCIRQAWSRWVSGSDNRPIPPRKPFP